MNYERFYEILLNTKEIDPLTVVSTKMSYMPVKELTKK